MTALFRALVVTVAASGTALVACSRSTPPEPSSQPNSGQPLASSSAPSPESQPLPGDPRAACDAFVAANAAAFASTRKTCSATELLLFEKTARNTDVRDKGNARPGENCLACAFNAGCLDDKSGADVNNECEDLGALTDGGAEKAASGVQLCLKALQCDLGDPSGAPKPKFGKSCAGPPRTGLRTACYCGEGVQTSDCVQEGKAAGPCVSQERAAFPGLTPTQIVSAFGAKSFPGGVANNLMSCLSMQGCNSCLY